MLIASPVYLREFLDLILAPQLTSVMSGNLTPVSLRFLIGKIRVTVFLS